MNRCHSCQLVLRHVTALPFTEEFRLNLYMCLNCGADNAETFIAIKMKLILKQTVFLYLFCVVKLSI
jgi:hypothetical protein